jgi:hypothetical protein
MLILAEGGRRGEGEGGGGGGAKEYQREVYM